MTVDRTTLVFFDASCIVAACGSPTGGSAFVLSLCRRRLLRGAVSVPVLEEVERNVAAHFPPRILSQYQKLIPPTSLLFVAAIDETATSSWSKHVGQKDAHVGAAAEACGATFLLTLDKRLAGAVNQRAGSPLVAISPGQFITTHLVHHPDHERLRDGQVL